MKIALYGMSGSGKSFVADAIRDKHGFTKVSTGPLCRSICATLYGDESKTHLNEVSEKLRELDTNIWIHAALRNVDDVDDVVFDSIRYISDYHFFQQRGFKLVKVESSSSAIMKRLKIRGQEITPEDFRHRTEWELTELDFDFTIKNDDVGGEGIDKQILLLLSL